MKKQEGRGENIYCAILIAKYNGGGGGALQQRRCCMPRIVLISAQSPNNKRISCEGHGAMVASLAVVAWPLQEICLRIRRLRTGQYYSCRSTPPSVHPPLCILKLVLRYVWFSLGPPVLPFKPTILGMAIPCEGQVVAGEVVLELYRIFVC